MPKSVRIGIVLESILVFATITASCAQETNIVSVESAGHALEELHIRWERATAAHKGRLERYTLLAKFYSELQELLAVLDQVDAQIMNRANNLGNSEANNRALSEAAKQDETALRVRGFLSSEVVGCSKTFLYQYSTLNFY